MWRSRLRVDDIPTDITTPCVKDKLAIHFLSSPNGGGPIENIELRNGPPIHAIVTFEDDKVVDSVLNINEHTLWIDEKTYRLRVGKLCGKLDLDEAEDPQPGKPYRGNTFEAYLPKNTEGRELLALYEKALNQNLTFKIKSTEEGEVVTWHLIPHKTCPDEGESKNGYPDSEYIKNTLALIKTLGIK
ncbi:E3 ubiquitin-protein ligase DTX3L-like isoform X2 [Pyxicephalus adspersus]|uniref:E3 ubiquitin-protein ligase DTX3L-like isoform X2 n=1 Tax=Pyxicephalus adspersus TaxID=30357 RepID=UPI003B5A3020